MSPDAVWRRYLGGCASLVGFAGAFWLLLMVRVPVVWYHPLERTFALETRAHTLGIDFYGRVLWASLAGAGLYPVGRWLAGRLAATSWRAWLAVAYGLSLMALTVGLVVYQIWPRPAAPLPIPAWYKP